jgi:myo-inositol-1(or 4)-monophosphatase
MKKMQNEVILKLSKKLGHVFGNSASDAISINRKSDNSIVTEIDLYVSGLLKNLIKEHKHFVDYTFYCEEDHEEYIFPCAILDPIDGTRELVKGRPECALSLALMKTPRINDPENYAWIYNPFSGFSLDSSTEFVPSFDKNIQKLLSFVSRNEFKKGRYEEYLNHPQIDIIPRGSIAFKLGLLASGACDFIVSLEPKNTWDIAAGTVLCAQRGIDFYVNGKIITDLSDAKYDGPLIWAPPSIAPIVLEAFKGHFKNEIDKSNT